MIVLGIDPGIATTGCAILEDERNGQKLLYAEAIKTAAGNSEANRLALIFDRLNTLIEKYKPAESVLENLFFNTNAKTAMIVGQARGIIQLALQKHHINITEYTPLQVKIAITGYGRADKNQIQQMVKNILKLPEILSPDDVADAAAIALTHCFSYKMSENIKSL